MSYPMFPVTEVPPSDSPALMSAREYMLERRVGELSRENAYLRMRADFYVKPEHSLVEPQTITAPIGHQRFEMLEVAGIDILRPHPDHDGLMHVIVSGRSGQGDLHYSYMVERHVARNFGRNYAAEMAVRFHRKMIAKLADLLVGRGTGSDA